MRVLNSALLGMQEHRIEALGSNIYVSISLTCTIAMTSCAVLTELCRYVPSVKLARSDK